MKNLITFYSILLLAIVSSCKKDNSPQEVPNDNKPKIAAVHDSVSYTVDGKRYIANSYSNSSTGNQQVGQKVVYNNNGTSYEIVGTPDSVLYYRQNSVSSEGSGLTLSIIKKYNKKDIKKAFLLYHPELEDLFKLYTVGKHPYAEDFGRENLHDGIALSVSVGGKSYFSYSTFDLQHTSKLKPGFQKNSTFEIISFTKTTSGGYNIEARFTTMVAEDFTENQKKVENGYLRLYLDPTLYPLF